jgi:branched-chain amino acid aminotransferase
MQEDLMAHSTHAHAPDTRNEHILIDINGELFPRAEARISVFDSGFILGDGIWEGLRVHDGVHVRLMVSRGIKSTPYQDPRATITPPTIVIIPEFKEPLPGTVENGIRLFTVHVRRGYPDVQDPKLNSHSKLNCILACIQAAKAGVDEALMLDPHGFVATCNSTHFFIVRRGEVWTSSGDYCLGGITRGNVLALCRDADIPAREKTFSLTDVYGADEAFVTGTFAGIVPVTEVDGRRIGTGARGAMVADLQRRYMTLIDRECEVEV